MSYLESEVHLNSSASSSQKRTLMPLAVLLFESTDNTNLTQVYGKVNQ